MSIGATEPSAAGAREPRVDEVGARVERLLDDLGQTDPRVAGLAEELVRSLVRLYGAGLVTILERLYAAEPDAIHELAQDPLVGGLMALHDLHPRPLVDRVEAALDECRPYLRSHGGDVTLLGVEDGVAHLRLEGTCDGCGASQLTLRDSIETALLAAAPDISRIEVEGAVPLGRGHAPPAGVEIPLDAGRDTLPLFQPTRP